MPHRTTRCLVIPALLASAMSLPLPLAAAERPVLAITSPAPMAAADTASSDAVPIVIAQNDVMVPDDEDEQQSSDASGTDRWSHATSRDDGGPTDHGWDRRGREGRGWDDAKDDRRRAGPDRGRGGWDGAEEMDRSPRDETPQERRRMMAMHGRMMQALQAQRQPAAGFRIEMGSTRMAVRCSPRETMRECVDAALSLVSRLRDGDKPARAPVGPDSGTPAPSSTPATPSPATPPGSGSGSPQ